MENTKKWNDILEEVLQCCVCLDIPNSMVLQCANGHVICRNCRRKLEQCPICKEEFIATKCLLAEDIISRIQDIKMSIAEEIMTKLQQHERQSVNISTQTSFATTTKCATTQTNNTDEKKKGQITFYQCCSCTSKLSYKKLIGHLIEQHKNVFYNIHQDADVVSKSFAIRIDKLPKIYNYAFFVNNMNLFFLKIDFDSTGELVVNLQVVDKNVVSTLFQYRFLITDGSCYLRRRGMVTSCLLQKETAYQHSVRIGDKEMSLLRTRSLQYTIIIKKCGHPIKVIDTRSNE